MKPPRVSIVIPAWNAAAFIEETLKTVAAQTFKDFELLVVDDGSKDDTAAVVDRFIAAHGLRGRAIKQENKKIAGARNTGWRAAQGELIAFLDHDDAWLPEKLARTIAMVDAHPEADLFCHDETVTEKGKVLRVTRNGPWTENFYERLLFQGNALSPSAVTVRRAKLEEVNGFREAPEFNTVEDYDIWMRLARVCRFYFWPEVLGEYHFEERGASRRIVYHHGNLELLLRDHFKTLYGDAPTLLQRLRMRRRLASVYRSALGLLSNYGEAPDDQRAYAAKLAAEFPFEPKNAARLALWAVKTWTR